MAETPCHHCGNELATVEPVAGVRSCCKCGKTSPANVTPDQAKDTERAHRYIEREGLLSLMNNTKWREAEEAIMGTMGHWPPCRIKTIRDVEENSFDPDYYHLKAVPRYLIEWLEFEPNMRVHRVHPGRQDFTETVASALLKLGVPFTREGSCLRIWGYARPGSVPTFADFVRD